MSRILKYRDEWSDKYILITIISKNIMIVDTKCLLCLRFSLNDIVIQRSSEKNFSNRFEKNITLFIIFYAIDDHIIDRNVRKIQNKKKFKKLITKF
jgi:hypothetical protein